MLLLLNCMKDSGRQGSSKNCGAGKGLAEEDLVDHIIVMLVIFFFSS